MSPLPRSRANPSKFRPALAVFAREPVPGKAKTRLIPLFGPQGAADFHAALVSDTLQKVNALGERVTPYFFLAGRKFPVSSSLSEYTLKRQQGASLGNRLEGAFRFLLRRHVGALVIGTDSPQLSSRDLLLALARLRGADAILGPCPDGGFYLVGLRRLTEGLFGNVRWGSEFAFEDVRSNLQAGGYACSILGALEDVDRTEDVERLKNILAGETRRRKLAPSTWRFLREFYALDRRRERVAARQPRGDSPSKP
ncbi:MAG TPA: TIGR04282 family arsenosugar biosynthesis glycosyltransferase [Terriglobia bacterium]|nr:TIGR04282 family arsenosugar biosynthesis glycosyltransferase [Terriglobia bacterium]